MKTTKLTLAMLLIVAVVLTCTFAGCGGKKIEIWGKTFTYEGNWNESYSNFPSSYSDNYLGFIDDNWDNIDWDKFILKTDDGDVKYNKADYKDARALLDSIGNLYAELAKDWVNNASFSFVKEGEETYANVVDTKGEAQKYKLILENEMYNFYEVAEDGTVDMDGMVMDRLSIYGDTYYENVGKQIIGAEFARTVEIPLINEVQGFGDMTDKIEVNFGINWNVAK